MLQRTKVGKLSDYKFCDEPIEIGIDEAGRGPVLGPMVYGVAFWPVSVGADMRKEFGFNDSKQVKEEDREKMFESIKDMEFKRMGWGADPLYPQFISSSMLNIETGKNLNAISFDSALGLIKEIYDAGFNVERIICD